jgi:hypothetical protein
VPRPEELDAALWQDLVEEEFLTLHKQVALDTAAHRPPELIYRTDDGQTTVHLVEDPRFLDALERALHHQNTDVRCEVIAMMGYSDWAEWRPILTRVAHEDRDDRVRDLAETFLAS